MKGTLLLITDTTLITHTYGTRSKITEKLPSYQADPYEGLEVAEGRGKKDRLSQSEYDNGPDRSSEIAPQTQEEQLLEEFKSKLKAQTRSDDQPLSDLEVDDIESNINPSFDDQGMASSTPLVTNDNEQAKGPEQEDGDLNGTGKPVESEHIKIDLTTASGNGKNGSDIVILHDNGSSISPETSNDFELVTPPPFKQTETTPDYQTDPTAKPHFPIDPPERPPESIPDKLNEPLNPEQPSALAKQSVFGQQTPETIDLPT